MADVQQQSKRGDYRRSSAIFIPDPVYLPPYLANIMRRRGYGGEWWW